ncbi:MAG: protein-export chaperone SecB [Rubricella sp.]
MADETEGQNGAAPAAAAAQQPVLPKMQIRAQYIRDMSFENIASQKGFSLTKQPQIRVSINVDGRKKEDLHEVMIKMEVKAEQDDQAVFLMEIDYAGLFSIENVPDNQLHPFMMIECPRMLFPYVRRIISDVTRDGGFPPVNVDNIDFLSLYRNELLRRQQAQQQQAPAGNA